MTQRSPMTSPTRAGTSWESYAVLGSVTILSGLVVADRFAAWLIGEFPTYALFWRIRFEFLRPIGVYYDLVERNFGALSPTTFSTAILIMAALIAAGVVSRIRLARAISCHVLLVVAAFLGFMSWDSGLSLRPHAMVGMTSQPYALLGIALALVAAAPCLRIHAEYIGWNPSSSYAARRIRISSRRLQLIGRLSVAEVIDQLAPMPNRLRTVVAAARATRYRSLDRHN